MSVATQALIEALQEALTLFELQKVHAGKLEQAASYSRMAKELSDSLNPGFSMAQRMIRQSSFFQSVCEVPLLQESVRLKFRYVRSFCDAYDALILLASEPQMQEKAKHIALLLRHLRFLEIERDAKAFSIENLPKPQAGMAEQSELERRQEVTNLTINVKEERDRDFDGMMSNPNTKSKQIEMLLRKALQMAESLLDETH
ncbi:MAG: hypothetical protein H7308_01420 [Chthonomonadaceae bacterium]|nr:hypothetical protein [Chthonomonadaceae bacterium]